MRGWCFGGSTRLKESAATPTAPAFRVVVAASLGNKKTRDRFLTVARLGLRLPSRTRGRGRDKPLAYFALRGAACTAAAASEAALKVALAAAVRLVSAASAACLAALLTDS